MQDESDAAGGQHGRGPLQLTALPGEDVEAIVDRQAENARGEIEDVRRWWLTELLTSPAPLRENLVLFLHGVFGCSTDAVDVPPCTGATPCSAGSAWAPSRICLQPSSSIPP